MKNQPSEGLAEKHLSVEELRAQLKRLEQELASAAEEGEGEGGGLSEVARPATLPRAAAILQQAAPCPVASARVAPVKRTRTPATRNHKEPGPAAQEKQTVRSRPPMLRQAPKPVSETPSEPPTKQAPRRIEPAPLPPPATQRTSRELPAKTPRTLLKGDGEHSLPLRWWNAPVLLVLLGIGLGVMGLGLEFLRTSLVVEELASAVEDPSRPMEDIVRASALVNTAPLLRFDARRDYLLSRAAIRYAPDEMKSAADALRRAVGKSPAQVAYKLELAKMLGTEASEPLWESLETVGAGEPVVMEELAGHSLDKGDKTRAFDLYRKALAANPHRSAAVVHRLLERLLPMKEAMDAVPSTPAALADLVTIPSLVNRDEFRRLVQERLTQIDPPAPNNAALSRSSVELADLATVWAWLGDEDRSRQLIEQAGGDSPELRVKLAMARIHWAKREYAESRRLVNEILASGGHFLRAPSQALVQELDRAENPRLTNAPSMRAN